jgi:NADH:ubiquinone oxidoreductase subunit 6 (subunit J)
MQETASYLPQLCFYAFGGLLLLAALGVVFHRSIVYSALLLLVAFISISGVFVLLNAPFIAAAEVMVYGVGLTIVMIFGIMLTGDKPISGEAESKPSLALRLAPIAIAFGFFAFITWGLLYPTAGGALRPFIPSIDPAMQISEAGAQAIIHDGGAQHLAQLLFNKYLIPFELASILLLLAMVGAIVMSKKQLPEEADAYALPEADNGLLNPPSETHVKHLAGASHV